MEELEAFMTCAYKIARCFKDLTGLRICEYSLSHRYISFIEYDNIYNKAYIFSERDAVKYDFKCSPRYEYFAVNPMVIDNEFATMTLIRVELNVNGKLHCKNVHAVVQSKMEG